jgi:hypothetical protein
VLKPFHKIFPDVAKGETRSVDLQDEGEPGGLPAGEYFFVESYCTNPDCDCVRVLIDVAARELGVIASISFDFDTSISISYKNKTNPCLDPQIRQSKYAEKALSLFKEVVRDKEYEDRLKRHFRLVKSAVGAWSGRDDGGVTSRQGERARQQRKQQKAARRKNRR